MKIWGLPPLFGVYPIHLLELGLPPHLRETYTILYTLGWRTEYRTVQQSVQQLADLFSVIEGKPLQARGMRKRLQDLADSGLVERSKKDGRWVTTLKLRHDTPAVSTGTGSASWSASSGTELVPVSDPVGVPHLDKSIVAVIDEPGNQQQQYSRCGIDIERNEQLLSEMGLVGSVVGRLAREEHVSAEYLETVKDYREQEASRGKILGPGWVVKCVGEGWEIPKQEQEPDRYRYIQGKYKEWVRH